MLRLASVPLVVLAACTPTPNPGGGQVTTACAFAPDQTNQDLRMNCTVTGAPGNRVINPVTGGSQCKLESLTLFNQALTVAATFIYGEGGDDSVGRVRIGAIVADGATHTGSLAKSVGNGCTSQSGPVAAISTTFGGRHVAIIDKGQVPHCVFQSRFSTSSFNQTLSLGFAVDPSAATRGATIEAIERALDLEAATAVNNLLGHDQAVDAAFRGRAGRCPDGWAQFTGS
jgi:hypothetical protein